MNSFLSVIKNQFIHLFKTIIYYDEQIDILRKQLFLTENFSPIDFFNSLDIHRKNFLSLTDFSEFLSFHNINFNSFTLRRLIRTYDKKNKFTIDYDNFLYFIKPKFLEENPQSYNNYHPHEIFINILIEELNLIGKIGDITFNIQNKKDFNVYEVFMNITRGNYCLFDYDIKRFINDKYIKDSKIENIIYRIDLDNDNKVSYKEFQEVFFPYKINYCYNFDLNNNNYLIQNFTPQNNYSLKNKIEDYIIYKTSNNNSRNEKISSIQKLSSNKTSPSIFEKNMCDKIPNNNSSFKTLLLESLTGKNSFKNKNNNINKPLNLKQSNLRQNKINVNNDVIENSFPPLRDLSITQKTYDYENINSNNIIQDNNINNPLIQDSIFSKNNNISSIIEERKNSDNLINNNYSLNDIYENNNINNNKAFDLSLNDIMFDNYKKNNYNRNNIEKTKKIIRYDYSNSNYSTSLNNKNSIKNKIRKEILRNSNNENIISNQETIIYPELKKIKEEEEKNVNIIEILDFITDKISKKNLLECLKEALCLKEDITLPNLFYIFDISKNEEITKENFIEVCKQLNLFPTNDQIYLLYKKYDLDNDNILNYEEFCQMILPLKEEYLIIIKNRQENMNNFTEISKESNLLLKNLIKAFIQVESYFYELKKKIKLRNFNLNNAWNNISQYSSNGEKLSKKDLENFLKDNLIFLTKFEIDLFFNDIDLDNDRFINYNDFEREIININ